jgi:hypothetical protein
MSNCYNSELPIGPPGPTGPQGLQGLQGIDGTIWLNGAGEPLPQNGVHNDYYLDTDTGDLYVKDFVGLALEWILITNIYGTDGLPGEPGVDGENGVALQWIPFGEEGGFFKSLGISSIITPDSTGINQNYYSSLFYIFGNDLCPVNDSVARITIFYETTGIESGASGPVAFVNHNLLISTGGNSTPVIGAGSSFIPKTFLSNTNNVYAFTKVCYTIRRKSLTTAEIITEWFTNTSVDDFLSNTAGSYYSSDFLTADNINFTPGVYNEFKFYPTISNTTPSSSPQTRAMSFYIEKLR